MEAARILRYRVKLAACVLTIMSLWAATPAEAGLSHSPQFNFSPGARLKGGRVDINRATMEELKSLPGIRDAWAEAIAKNRPYKNKTQLLTRKILPFTAYKAIEGKIIAKQ